MNINFNNIDPKSAAIGAGALVAVTGLVKASVWGYKKLTASKQQPAATKKEAAPAAAPAEAAPAAAATA